VEECSHGALSLKDGKVFFNAEKCAGCGECVLVCDFKAIELTWDESTSAVQEKMRSMRWAP